MFLLGAALTLATAYALGVALFRKFPAILQCALGATVQSTLIYFLFLFNQGQYLYILFAAIPVLFFLRPKNKVEQAVSPAILLFSVYGIYYLIQALAPEIQPDAISYHLGLVAEYLRLGHFPPRVGFYEVLPQGLEMLFAAAFQIGGATAAKLVHFAFLLATVPLIVLTARRLNLTDTQGYLAAALYFMAPVVGISGTCAYNDAALVFFTLSTFYLLLLWRDTNLATYALAAGLTAGFCYAIKFTGLIVPPLAILFILFDRRDSKALLCLSLGSALMIAPWMLRALYLTHNPFAPLFNTLFPNLYFNPVTEHDLARALSSYPGFHWPTALWNWAIVGSTQGVVGPLILAAPLALVALRKPAGRLLVAATLLLLAPVAFNVGTRFLMPALPFLALALAIAIPRPALIALTVLQAIICFPPIIVKLEQPQAWALRGFPWRAALRLQSESDYLKANGDYIVATFLESHTTPQDRVFALNGMSKLFTTRDVLEYWHSNRAVRYTAALQSAFANTLMVQARANWKPALLTGIRFTSTADYPREWIIFEARLYSPGGFIYASPQWNFAASPNLSDAPSAFDGNRTTAWTSRSPQRRGMYLEARFHHPQLLDSAVFLIAANAPQPGFIVEGRNASTGKWQLLLDRFNARVIPNQDLRQEAVHALKLAGFTTISVYTSGDGLGAIGRDMVKHPWQWNLADLGSYGDFHLMRIEPPEYPG
jgi:uncharacterized membrane protein YhaH (DUF805 family)